MQGLPTTVNATYRVEDGCHVFTSDDLPGLYVASRNLAAAFADVAPSIQALIELDEGVICTVAPEVPFDEWLALSKGAPWDFDSPVPQQRRFVVLGSGRV